MPPKKNKDKVSYYAVKYGSVPGIYTTWEECKIQINGYKNPVYKKFNTKEDAQAFIDGTATSTEEHLMFLKYIKHDSFNPDYNFPIEDWTSYQDQYYFFTDGSQRIINGQKVCRLGVYIGENARNITELQHKSTNNRCELLSIMYVLQIADLKKSELKHIFNDEEESINGITIVSDSKYCISACQDWIYNWQKNNWQTAQKKDVLNQDIFKKVLILLQKLKLHKITINFKHVNSHQPPPLTNEEGMFLWIGNNAADFLAQGKSFF